ncbi:MAG: DUF4188 domain-containing protein [Nitrospiraceae bacterium]
MIASHLRRTVDLSAFPDLVVIMLGMRVNRLTGLKTLFGFGPKIASSVADTPDGLLWHESLVYSLFPPHIGMRQYWRDFDALERYARSDPHRQWWQDFLRDTGGTGFWHETYFMRGGMEAVYNDVPSPIGLLNVAPIVPATGGGYTARLRAGLKAKADALPVPIEEAAIYGTESAPSGSHRHSS